MSCYILPKNSDFFEADFMKSRNGSIANHLLLISEDLEEDLEGKYNKSWLFVTYSKIEFELTTKGLF